MKIFIIHDPADETASQAIERALQQASHTVYRRGGTLDPGKTSAQSVRTSMARSEFALFIATRAATTQGSLALSDLALAHEQWRDPKGRILILKVNDSAPDPADPRFSAFPKAGPFASPEDAVRLVAEETQRRSRRRFSVGTIAVAGLAIAVPLAGLAYFLTTGSGSLPGSSAQSVPAGDIEFAVDIDYTDTMNFGETRHFKLSQTVGQPFDYRCKAGPSPSPNIKTVTHDEKCTEIAVTAADGPFVDAEGRPYPGSNYYPERDIVPVVVTTVSGQDVFKFSFQFNVSNAQTGFLLRGLDTAKQVWPTDLTTSFVVNAGKAYELEVLTRSGTALPDAWTCSAKPLAEYEERAYRLTTLKGCRFRLENPQPGGLWVVASRRDPDFSLELLFDLSSPSATPLGSEDLSSAGVSPQQMLDGLRADRKRFGAWLERRKANVAKGAVPDEWYLTYLERLIAESDGAIARLERAK